MPDSLAETFASLPAGRTHRGALDVGGFASGARMVQPWNLLKGAVDGPCLWINGSVHGTEINGILAAMDFMSGLDPATLRGSVVLTPFANPLAIDNRQKNTPSDGQDLDQTFPGNPKGQITDRMSARLFAALSGVADLLISMHTMGAPFNSKPYCVYKAHPGSGVSEPQLMRLMRHFNPAVVCLMPVAPGQGELPGNISGGIDYQMLERGKPAFMVELGGGSRAQEDFIAQGVRGLLGVAAELGMIDAASAVAPPASLCRVTRRRHVTCDEGGLFRAMAEPGHEIPAGQPVGRIHSAHGDTVETLRFDAPVRLIGVRSDPVVHTGDRVAFVATEWASVPVG